MRIRPHLILLLVAFAASGCSSNETEPVAPPRPVKYALVESSGGRLERTYAGVTRSSSLTNLSFRTGGLLLELRVQVGRRVRKGELLARLDQKDVTIAYEQAQVDVRNAKAQFDAASSAYQRVKQLYETNNASLSDLEAAKSSYSSAQSAYEISLKRLELQKSKIDHTVIVAPMDGIVSAVESEVNEVVQAGRTIVVMSREGDSDIEARVGVPERHIRDVQNGMAVQVYINSLKDTVNGLVTEIAYGSSSGGATYPVTIALDAGPAMGIRPDVPVDVVFRFGSEREQPQVMVPLKAVASGVDGSYVFVLDTTGTEGLHQVRKAMVELGELTGDGYAIRSGVSDGELVAVAGLSSLFDGLRVTLLKPELP